MCLPLTSTTPATALELYLDAVVRPPLFHEAVWLDVQRMSARDYAAKHGLRSLGRTTRSSQWRWKNAEHVITLGPFNGDPRGYFHFERRH
jgi:hypothetical protein